jgi:hypothetical protein
MIARKLAGISDSQTLVESHLVLTNTNLCEVLQGVRDDIVAKDVER